MKNRLIEIIYALKDRFSRQSKKVEDSIKRTEKASDKSSKKIAQNNKLAAASFGALGKAIAKVAIIYAGVLKAIGTAKEIIQVNIEFQKLNASLITVTGSAEKAQEAFEGLEDFATSTPYSLNEVVQGFIKLKALGLDPSREALESYGNTASAMGKTLNDFVEAIADAATGEFERLKEFGIKASSQGDQVALTFQGVTTVVKKSADDIEGYLRKIGQVQFAGAMERQMDTIGGAMSNLGDEADALARNLGESGLNAAVQSLVAKMSLLLSKMNDSIDTLQTYADPQGINKFNLALNEEISLTDTIIQQTQFLNSVRSETQRQGIIEGINQLINKREEVRKEIDAYRESEYIRSKGEDENVDKGAAVAESAKQTAKALQDSVGRIKDIQTEFQNIVNEISSGPGEVDFIDVSKAKLDAETLLDQGDFKGAIEKAREAATLLKRLKDQGDESTVAMDYVAKELQKIAVDAAELDVLVQPMIQVETKELQQAKQEILEWATTVTPVIIPKIVLPDTAPGELLPYFDIPVDAELDKRGSP